jgi:hypothetical protein
MTRSNLMLNSYRKIAGVIILCAGLSESGCASMSPHENFKAHLHAAIGQRMDRIPPYHWPYERDFVNTKILPNGDIEKTYKYLRTCKYIFEINPGTNTIVGARFEGSENDCVINP